MSVFTNIFLVRPTVERLIIQTSYTFARRGPGPGEVDSPPGLKNQELCSEFLCSIHFLVDFSAFYQSLFTESFCLLSVFVLRVFLPSISLCSQSLSAFYQSLFSGAFCLLSVFVYRVFLPSISLCSQSLSAFYQSLFSGSFCLLSVFVLGVFLPSISLCSQGLSAFYQSLFSGSFCLLSVFVLRVFLPSISLCSQGLSAFYQSLFSGSFCLLSVFVLRVFLPSISLCSQGLSALPAYSSAGICGFCFFLKFHKLLHLASVPEVDMGVPARWLKCHTRRNFHRYSFLKSSRSATKKSESHCWR